MDVRKAIIPGEPRSSTIEVLKEIGSNERHFNTIQAEYRKLASGWMIAALGAMGWVHSHLKDEHATRLACLIAMGSSIGVALLWLLDRGVYHALLVANCVAAERLERLAAPKYHVHNKVRRDVGDDLVGQKIDLFYLGLIAAVPVALMAGYYDLLTQARQDEILVVPLLSCMGVLGRGLIIKLKNVKESRFEETSIGRLLLTGTTAQK
ncbi:hypothetical protein [Dyella acidiphila]|uniref:Uncharacterized protein n=1 Tax=Dyella acidiphila TaxID=2775866 RepID=A0ABR9GFG5_9GAMM|nr:hypothetical protein [Dyella acidiphila]MBE1162779.1 hypothetical protein [Dyella acidiphila]